jgi:hypothetical protein
MTSISLSSRTIAVVAVTTIAVNTIAVVPAMRPESTQTRNANHHAQLGGVQERVQHDPVCQEVGGKVDCACRARNQAASIVSSLSSAPRRMGRRASPSASRPLKP